MLYLKGWLWEYICCGMCSHPCTCLLTTRHLNAFLRSECKAQVHCVPNNIYQGFNSWLSTECTYVAFTLGAVHVLPSCGSPMRTPFVWVSGTGTEEYTNHSRVSKISLISSVILTLIQTMSDTPNGTKSIPFSAIM